MRLSKAFRRWSPAQLTADALLADAEVRAGIEAEQAEAALDAPLPQALCGMTRRLFPTRGRFRRFAGGS